MAKKDNTFFLNTFKISAGNVLAHLVLLLSAPLLARLYLPKAFGVAEIVIALAGTWNVISSLRYELALMLPRSDNDGASLFLLSLLLDNISSIVLFIIILVWNSNIAALLRINEYKNFLFLLPLLVLVAGIYQALVSWNSRTKEFGHITRYRVTSTTGGVLAQFSAGLVGYANPGGLITGRIAGLTVSGFFWARAIWKRDADSIRTGFQAKRMWNLAIRYWKFPVFNTWNSLLNSLSWQAPVWLLGVFFSPTVAGFYAMANRLLHMPMNILGKSVGTVFFQHAAEVVHDGNLGQAVDKVFRYLFALGLIPTILLLAAGEELAAVFLGDGWREAGIYIEILAPFLLFWFVSSPLMRLINVKERQEIGLIIQVVILLARVVPLVIGGLKGDARLTITALSISGIAAYGWLSCWLIGIGEGSRVGALRVAMLYLLFYSPWITILVVVKWVLCIQGLPLLGITGMIGIGCLLCLAYVDSNIRVALSDVIRSQVKASRTI